MREREDARLDELLASLARRVRAQAPVASLCGETARALRAGAAVQRISLPLLCVFTVALFAAVHPFFTYDPVFFLNGVKLFLLLVCLVSGALFFLYPARMAALDGRLLSGVLLRFAPRRPDFLDLAFFRFQGLYFIVTAFFIARL